MAPSVKNPVTWVPSLVPEEDLKRRKWQPTPAYSCFIIPLWTEGFRRLQSMEREESDVTEATEHTHMRTLCSSFCFGSLKVQQRWIEQAKLHTSFISSRRRRHKRKADTFRSVGEPSLSGARGWWICTGAWRQYTEPPLASLRFEMLSRPQRLNTDVLRNKRYVLIGFMIAAEPIPRGNVRNKFLWWEWWELPFSVDNLVAEEMMGCCRPRRLLAWNTLVGGVCTLVCVCARTRRWTEHLKSEQVPW